MRHLAATLLAVAACLCCSPADSGPPAGPRLRLWHTFSPRETQALTRALAGAAGEATPLPFSRAHTVVRDTLRGRGDCPDLIRIDATWLSGLVTEGLLQPVPRAGSEPTWLPEAAALASHGGQRFGLPQSLDGLALVYDAERLRGSGVGWPPTTIDDLVAAARALTRDGALGLSARVDGYWFIAFLHAWGGAALDPEAGTLGIDTAPAVTALERFASLFDPVDGVAPPPAPPGDEAPTLARRFRAGQVAIAVDGPWALPDLGGDRALGVAAFPRDPEGRPDAPYGGHLFAVPGCARQPEAAWALARRLTAPGLQAGWSRELGLVPTSVEALEQAGELARRYYAALAGARPLRRHPATTEMFDDLSPAVAAVVAGDATAAEALAGVARAWTRLLDRHGVQVRPPPAASPGAAGAAR
jgi:arabinogalactan oligomer/maltooligosaccharide transport system substrate-binding protein